MTSLTQVLHRNYTPVIPDGDRTATRKCTRSPANVNTTQEKSHKITNLNKSVFLYGGGEYIIYIIIMAFLLRFNGDHHAHVI